MSIWFLNLLSMFALTWKKFRRYEINGCHNQRFQEFPDFSLFFPDKCKISLFNRFNIQFNKLVLIMGSTRSVRLSTLHSSVSLAAVFWMSRNAPPKERCVTSKKRLRGRLSLYVYAISKSRAAYMN